jgi:signal transduction histidine kinase
LKNANSARYLLAPGVYSLHLKGSSDGNNWSKEIVIPIVINPAWWQTGLFRWATVIALLSVFGFGAWYFNKIKTSKLKHQLHVEQEMQKERERISRDLHDHIGAYSTALIANADSLDQRVEDEKLRATVLRLKENSRYVLSALRETIWVLNTKNLTVTGFYEGFINYSTNILRNHEGIEIEFKDEIFRNAQLHPAIAIQLLRILQEVVQNTIKHARASKVSCIFCCNRKIMITISDNGQGYAAEAIQLGNGLRNIEQRAKEIGFQLETTSIVGEGTKVTICGDV